jgi:hypothetical protein
MNAITVNTVASCGALMFVFSLLIDQRLERLYFFRQHLALRAFVAWCGGVLFIGYGLSVIKTYVIALVIGAILCAILLSLKYWYFERK